MNRLTAWNGAEEVLISSAGSDKYGASFRSVTMMPQGYPSVDYMLRQNRFYIAHRGGSVNFPEHSMLAYTNSVALGTQALEFSFARTKDGVWFGNHDLTLLRTTGVDVDPSRLSWEEVKKIKIKGNLGTQNWPDQDHLKFEDFAKTYGHTHVIFADPKYEQSRNRKEFFAMLKRLVPNATERVVIKYFYNATDLARDARAEGFKTWGYYYTDDLTKDPAVVDKTGSFWDIFGLEYNASQATYDKMKSYGKPLLVHIVPDAPGADMGWSRGADGMMCSGPRDIVPFINTTAQIGA